MPRGCWPASSRRPANRSISIRSRVIARCFRDRCHLLAELFLGGDDAERLDRLAQAARQARSAAGGRRRHSLSRGPSGGPGRLPGGHPLGRNRGAARGQLFPNAERHLQSLEALAARFAAQPAALARSVEIARLSTFSLDELRYEYPEELAPPGETPPAYLTRLTWQGARRALSGRHSRSGSCG